MDQAKYDRLHEQLLQGIELYRIGFLTTAEFLFKAAELRAQLPDTHEQLVGVVDTNTGLRFSFNQ